LSGYKGKLMKRYETNGIGIFVTAFVLGCITTLIVPNIWWLLEPSSDEGGRQTAAERHAFEKRELAELAVLFKEDPSAVDYVDDWYGIPLMRTIANPWESGEKRALLLANNADPTKISRKEHNNHGHSPMSLAAWEGDFAALGAFLAVEDKSHWRNPIEIARAKHIVEMEYLDKLDSVVWP
jgi:hypothetical protein